MKHSIKNFCVVLIAVTSLVGISSVTKNNYKSLHDGVRPVVEYTESNRTYQSPGEIGGVF